MNISNRVRHQLYWLNLPATLLIALLQRTPALKLVGLAEEMVVSSPLGAVLRSAFLGVASLGALHTMAGATQLTTSQPSPLNVSAGSPITPVAFEITGVDVGAAYWDVSGSMPPGLSFNGVTSGPVDGETILLSGTPTTGGTYDIFVTAFNPSYGGQLGPYTYTINVSGSSGTAPSITLHPGNQTVTAGTNAQFNAAASGSPTPTLQWQRQPAAGGGFTNLSEGGNYTGTTTGTLTVSGTSTGMTGDQFRCVATNSVSSATSNPASLTVNSATSAPSFTLHPSDQTVSAGINAQFTAAATGSPTPTFQWQRQPAGSGVFSNLSEGGNYTGTTSGTLTVSGTVTGMTSDLFRCVATNSVTSVNSNPASLTVNSATSAPSFTLHPGNQTVTVGTNAQFNAAANGSPAPTLQWQRQPGAGGGFTNLSEGGNYTGTTTTTLTVSGAATGMTGDQFRCVATNSVSSATSNAAMLTVNLVIFGALGDLNGDGKSDILLTNTVTGDRAVWLMNGMTIGDGAFLPAQTTNWVFSGIGDFDSDGKSDLILSNTSSGDRAIWLMNGTSIKAGVYLGVLPTSWSINGTGDFNGDGKRDILLTNTVTGDRALWLMNGTSIQAGVYLPSQPISWAFSGIGDFDGDGKSDILLTNTTSGERAIWLMDGTSISAGAYLGVQATVWEISGIGDFDADGKSDVLLTNTATGDRAMWLMNGAAISAGAYLPAQPTSWVFSRVGDFNGDGKADIFLTNTATGDRAVWLMNGTSVNAGQYIGVLDPVWAITR